MTPTRGTLLVNRGKISRKEINIVPLLMLRMGMIYENESDRNTLFEAKGTYALHGLSFKPISSKS